MPALTKLRFLLMTKQTNHTFPVDPDAFVRAAECANFLSIGLSTWWAWVQKGRVERPKKIGPRTSVWKAGYVRELQESLHMEAR